MTMKLVILDRDGVINEESSAYVKSPDELHFIPGSIEAIAKLNSLGFKVAIATNQAGIGRGIFKDSDLQAIHEKLLNTLTAAGAHIDHIAYCPHHPNDLCDCRKPKPGMLQQIAKHYHTDLHDVFFVGDSLTDLQAAINAGAKPALVKTGYGEKTQTELNQLNCTAPIYDNLADFATQLASASVAILP
jgi:D-glycero-D-manno-heptose 1,7-bisphosphate phosphatase